MCQVLDQVAEIDAALGQEEENDAVATEQVLDGRQLHRQTAILDPLLAELPFFLLRLVNVPFIHQVVLCGNAADGPDALQGPALVGHLAIAHAQGGADLQAPVALDDHPGMSRDFSRLRAEQAKGAHAAIANTDQGLVRIRFLLPEVLALDRLLRLGGGLDGRLATLSGGLLGRSFGGGFRGRTLSGLVGRLLGNRLGGFSSRRLRGFRIVLTVRADALVLVIVYHLCLSSSFGSAGATPVAGRAGR